MRKISSIFTLITLIVCILISSQSVFAADVDTSVTDIPSRAIYRLFNPVNGEHLYTSSRKEVDNLTENGWINENIAWYAPRAGKPVYRLYNEAGAKDHLYTTDEQEITILTTQHGWILDNDGQPLFYSDGPIPIYRLWNPSNNLHHLTTDITEYNSLPTLGWIQEGIAFNAMPSSTKVEYPMGNCDISNIHSEYAIQADVFLTGAGSGYHAKIFAGSPVSAVSFGSQYDEDGLNEYRDGTSFIIENVTSNNPGEQEYIRTGYSERNKTFRLLLTVQTDGKVDVFVNGTKQGSCYQPNLANAPFLDLHVEGSARHPGDYVNAVFTNIKVKRHGLYDGTKKWRTDIIDTNPTIKSDVSRYESEGKVSITGTISGIGDSDDWDSAYNSCSGIVSFYEK